MTAFWRVECAGEFFGYTMESHPEGERTQEGGEKNNNIHRKISLIIKEKEWEVNYEAHEGYDFIFGFGFSGSVFF